MEDRATLENRVLRVPMVVRERLGTQAGMVSPAYQVWSFVTGQLLKNYVHVQICFYKISKRNQGLESLENVEFEWSKLNALKSLNFTKLS